MANKSGFILVDASEVTSMMDIARNALRPRSGEGGTSPQHLDAIVKGLRQQAKEQQQAAAKELAESRTLGKSVKDILKFVKDLKDNLINKVDEQKKMAEDIFKQAAEKAGVGKRPERTPTTAPIADIDASYDIGSLRKAIKDINGMLGSARVANDLISDVQASLNNLNEQKKLINDIIEQSSEKAFTGTAYDISILRKAIDGTLNSTIAANNPIEDMRAIFNNLNEQKKLIYDILNQTAEKDVTDVAYDTNRLSKAIEGTLNSTIAANNPIEDMRAGLNIYEQKKPDENIFEQASEKVGNVSVAERIPTTSSIADTGSSYDINSIRKNIDGMLGPTSAANDLIEEMQAGFERVRQSAIVLADELYGHSILPEIQEHLQEIIDKINIIKSYEDLLKTMASAAGGSEAKFVSEDRTGHNGINEIEKIFGDHLQNLANLLEEDRKKFMDELRIQLNEIQGGIISGIGVGFAGGGAGGGGNKGLEAIREPEFQDLVFAALRKDLLLGIKGGLDTFMSFQIPAAINNIQQLNKEINNLQGGMAGNVKLAREFRIETTNAIQKIRSTAGFTIEQIGSATQQVMALGVSGPEMIAKQSEAILLGARAIGAEVSDVAQTYGLQARNLKLSTEQISEMISGTLRIARETSLTAKNVLEMRKETQGFVEELRRSGNFSAQLTNELTRIQAISSKMGLGTFQQDLQKVFMDMSQLGNVPDDLAIITAYVRNDLVKMGYSVNEILSGTMLATVQGQRDFAKATKDSLQLLLRQAETMGSEAGSANYLQNITKGRIRSLSELNRLIQLQTQASESQAEKAERLKKIEAQLVEMRASGLSEALMGNAIAELTGDTSLKTIDDVRAAISIAQQNIATEQENIAADFMNKLIKRQAQIMSTTGMDASSARDKAFKEMSGTIRGEISGMSMQEISSLAARASQRASEDVVRSAEAATDNMVDRVAQGVQKGIQMAVGPFVDLFNFFDRMGVGPFVAGVAMFGTAAIMLTSSIKSLLAILEKIGISKLFKRGQGERVPGAGDLMTRAAPAAEVTGNAASAAAAEKAAVEASSTTAATARTISDYVVQIGDAGEELWNQKGRLIKGLAVLTMIGGAIGASIWLMSKVYPDAGVVMNLTAAIVGSTVAFATLMGAFYLMNTIGKGAQEISKTLAKEMLVGLLALTATGILIGGAMHLLVLAFPDAGKVLGTALAIGASAIAFAVLAVSLEQLIQTGTKLISLTGAKALFALGAFAVSLAVLGVTAVALGGAMALLINVFPRADQIVEVSKALGASALAFGILAGAFLGIMAVGGIVVGLMFTPAVGPLAVLGAISLGIAALAITAITMSKGMEMLRSHFKNADKIKATGDAVAAAAEAFGTLAGAFLKLMAMGGLLVVLPIVGFLLPIGALWVLVDFAGRMDEAIGMLERSFRDDEEIQKTAKTVELASGAIKSLGEAYKSAVDAADLSWWKAGIDLTNNQRALRSLLTFGQQLGPYMDNLQLAYKDTDQMREVAQRVKNAAEVIKSLASAGVELKKYKDETDGIFSDITPEDLTATMRDLTQIAESMGRYIPKIVANAPDAADAGRIKNAADAMTSIAKMMDVTLDMQREFGEGTFTSGPMDAMETFMKQLGRRMSDRRGGFHTLKRGIERMPAFKEDEVEKLHMMNEATRAVFDTLKTLGEINDEFPNSSTMGRDLGDIKKTLDLTVSVFDENIRPLKNLKNILGMMPSDIDDRAEAFATMLATLKTAILNIESLAKEFPQGSERSMQVMNEHLRYIANNLDHEAVQALSDTFSNVALDLPNRIDALAGGFERLPNLLIQVQRFISRVDRNALTRAHDDILFIAWALAPIADLAESLTFEAPNIEHFEREIANLIQTIGAATVVIPGLLEYRAKVEAKNNNSDDTVGTPKTMNAALNGARGTDNTIGNHDGDVSTRIDSDTGASIVSMGGTENRLDTLITEQQQTNYLVRKLISALLAPPVKQQKSGIAPMVMASRTGAPKQNVDSAWLPKEEIGMG